MIGAMFCAMSSIIACSLLRQADCSPSSSAASCAETKGCGSSMSPRMMAIFLMISEMPCKASSTNPISSSALAGQMISPPALVEISPLLKDVHDIGHEVDSSSAARRASGRRHARTGRSSAACAATTAVEDVDADMFVLLQRIGGGEHEGRAEEIPLQFQPGIRRHVEHLADDGVAGADQDCQQEPARLRIFR